MIPEVDAFFTTYNPGQHPEKVECPVLLFHARDDSVVPVSESESFASTLKGLGKDVTLAIVPSGDHYDPMIRQGIPKAIAWFNGQDPSTVGADRPAPVPGDANSPAVNPPVGQNRNGSRMPPPPTRPGPRFRPGRPGGPQ